MRGQDRFWSAGMALIGPFYYCFDLMTVFGDFLCVTGPV
jgi:hypothetical protein